MKMLRRALAGAAAVVLLLTVFAIGLAWYVRPVEELDLSYKPVPLTSHISDMLAARKLQVVISEEELNDLLLKALAAHPQISPQLTLTGARFRLDHETIAADVNLLYREKWPVGVTVYFEMRWKEPLLEVVHTRTEIRQTELPGRWFRIPPLAVSLDEYLPRFLKVSSVQFSGKAMVLAFGLK